MKRILALCFTLALLAAPALCEEPADDRLFRMLSEDGTEITQRMGGMCVGDEYIASDNMLYEIVSVDEAARTASARCLGPEPENAVEASAQKENPRRLICMYSTHSDESYVPTDGKSSLKKGAGIYDVGNALKENLEKLGIDVTYSEETFLPHDAGAYRRSRSVASELLSDRPDALIDIHRDGVPAEQYETTVDGEEASKVRLFVGKSNASASANRAFAKQLKAAADEEYPGLVKDIYIGKGNYNQDLYGQSILLEFGTHEIDKELAVNSTEYMANVLNNVLYNGEEAPKESTGGAANGVIWLIVAAVILAIGYAVLSTGSFKGAGAKLKRGVSEITGGWFGKKK